MSISAEIAKIQEIHNVSNTKLCQIMDLNNRTLKRKMDEDDFTLKEVGRFVKFLISELDIDISEYTLLSTQLSYWCKTDDSLIKIPSEGIEMQYPTSVLRDEDTYEITIVNPSASAGNGSEIYGIEEFDSDDVLHVAKELFRFEPSQKLRAIRVDGHSMMPMLPPDSWVIFDNNREITQDGLYVINRDNTLIVKLIEKDPAGRVHVKSTAPGYSSWVIEPDDQTYWHIVGRVVRAVI